MNTHRWQVSLILVLALAAPLTAWAGAFEDEEKDVKKLVQKLKSKDAKERSDAASKLGVIGDEAKSAVPALIELNKDKDWFVRACAMHSLGEIVKNLKSQDPEVKATLKALLDALKDTKAPDNDMFQVCKEILGSLGEIAEQEDAAHAKVIVPAVLPFLKHKDPGVRGGAAETLGDCKEHAKAAVPSLVQMLRDPDDEVKKFAASALKDIDPATAKKYGIE